MMCPCGPELIITRTAEQQLRDVLQPLHAQLLDAGRENDGLERLGEKVALLILGWHVLDLDALLGVGQQLRANSQGAAVRSAQVPKPLRVSLLHGDDSLRVVLQDPHVEPAA